MTLAPYQYELNGVKFGRDTEIPIQKVDLQPYNVNNQDFQVQRSDENRFGIDTLTPSPMVFSMSVLQNFQLESMSGLSSAPAPEDLFAANGSSLNQLASVWKSPDLRLTWGSTIPLKFCDRDGNVRRIYGRPGKFVHAPRHKQGEFWIDVQAEFRRADTYAHSDIEYYVGHPTVLSEGLPPDGTIVEAYRQGGDGPSWLRFLIYGPATHPVISYGDQTLEMSSEIPPGVVVEVSSYPWQRRVVDGNSVNRRTEVIGDTLYLDQIKFPAFTGMQISWTCEDADAESTQLLVLWREAYNVI